MTVKNSEAVDIVVTYVDNTDPVWQKQVSQFNSTLDDKRYRNWDNFDLWYRLVKKNMKFVNNIFMVVSTESQVPEWVKDTDIKVVLHEQIIPSEFLPTFNSTTIEMFLCKIPSLSEKFIYFNDDMFPVKELSIEDFFIDGKPLYELVKRTDCRNSFRMQCRNSYRLAAQALGVKTVDSSYFYIRHSADPMLKSTCEEVWSKVGDKILDKVTKFREPFNFTQYLFPDYDVLRGNYVETKYSFSYYETVKIKSILCIDAIDSKIICFNDTSKIFDFLVTKSIILNFLKRCL